MGIVYVIDDDSSFRSALARRLRASGHEARCFSTAAEFLDHDREDAPACAIVDLWMTNSSGHDLHEAIQKSSKTLPVIFVSANGDVPNTVRAMRGGAVDFLTKPVKGEVVLEAVKRALAYGQSRLVTHDRTRELSERYERLTLREKEVFACVTAGRLNKQTAAELGISERTVKAHRARIMEKMEVESIAALARVAEELRPNQDAA